ncbi:unnamed protein product [Dracunculus medinensis]|uniref:Endoribonuclease n=1 Tax=Dracunculus medinensis TaxID=318479 RepID=A0A0N4UJU4_DRAME|nr:unnamed protein product [Dracunculus medinensis]
MVTHLNITLEFHVSDEDLLQFVNYLREEDSNKARPDQIELDFQGHTTTRDEQDQAKNRLFKYVDPALLKKETYKNFIALSDNFNRQTGISEIETNEAIFICLHLLNIIEKAEIDRFLQSLFTTKLWEDLYEFLHSKGHPFATDRKTLFRWVKQLWFGFYSRSRGLADTSGFEHVFMGEIKNDEVSGMHSWLRFYLLERNASENFDYKGFLIKRFEVMAAVKFSWWEQIKRSGSFMIGTSPEFDLAVFTLCFLSRRSRRTCDIEIDGCPVLITSFDLPQRGKIFIGSIYPVAGRITESCRQYHG